MVSANQPNFFNVLSGRKEHSKLLFYASCEKVCIQLQNALMSTAKLTIYIIWVHPSMVMHWKTVIMLKKILSKVVIPSFGPCQCSLHV